MRVFFDLEFSALSKDAQILSAGFAAENGPEFYVEMEDVSPSQFSPFVQDVVVPLLRGPSALVLPEEQALAAILDWLSAFDSPVLVSDSEWDSSLLGSLIRKYAKEDSVPLSYDLLAFSSGYAARQYQESDLEYFLRNKGMRHHALHDAKALRQGVLRAEGYY